MSSGVLIRGKDKTAVPPILYTPTVGADSIRPQADGTERFGEWNQLPAIALGFPRGEAVTMKYRQFGTDILS